MKKSLTLLVLAASLCSAQAGHTSIYPASDFVGTNFLKATNAVQMRALLGLGNSNTFAIPSFFRGANSTLMLTNKSSDGATPSTNDVFLQDAYGNSIVWKYGAGGGGLEFVAPGAEMDFYGANDPRWGTIDFGNSGGGMDNSTNPPCYTVVEIPYQVDPGLQGFNLLFNEGYHDSAAFKFIQAKPNDDFTCDGSWVLQSFGNQAEDYQNAHWSSTTNAFPVSTIAGNWSFDYGNGEAADGGDGRIIISNAFWKIGPINGLLATNLQSINLVGPIPPALITNVPAAALPFTICTGMTNIPATSNSLVIALGGHVMPSTNYIPSVAVFGPAMTGTNFITFTALTPTNFTAYFAAPLGAANTNLGWSAIYAP